MSTVEEVGDISIQLLVVNHQLSCFWFIFVDGIIVIHLTWRQHQTNREHLFGFLFLQFLFFCWLCLLIRCLCCGSFWLFARSCFLALLLWLVFFCDSRLLGLVGAFVFFGLLRLKSCCLFLLLTKSTVQSQSLLIVHLKELANVVVAREMKFHWYHEAIYPFLWRELKLVFTPSFTYPAMRRSLKSDLVQVPLYATLQVWLYPCEHLVLSHIF